jgi:Holliday junction resolvasome RuvABC endonuclease subunit
MKVGSALPLTLAIHPNARGFGWVLFEGPFRLLGWSVTHSRGPVNAACLRRLDRLLTRYSPETLVLEAFEGDSTKRGTRIAKLGRSIVSLAQMRNVEVAIYRFADVQECFATVGARTRHEIAETIARYHEPLAVSLPKKRAIWDPEDRRAAIFAAAALVLTHYHKGADQVLIEHAA